MPISVRIRIAAKKAILLTALLSVFIYIGVKTSANAYSLPEAMISAQLVDEGGLPISGQKVIVGFEGSGRRGKISRTTDLQGRVSATYGTTGRVAFQVLSEGYYGTYSFYQFARIEPRKFPFGTNKWLPWNPEVKLLLRKIENPVPMFARNTKKSGLQIPVIGKEVGFDLIAYDWMPPYGDGKHPDFIFTLDKRLVSQDDFDSTLTLTFPNKVDGIILIKEDRRNGSIFKLPRFAPESGYQSKLVRYFRRSPGKPIEDSTAEDNNYIFRIRSEVVDGKLVQAIYGKIQSDISVYPGYHKTAAIVFTYYLNPDHTRNLEYSGKRNLFEDLPSRERVDY